MATHVESRVVSSTGSDRTSGRDIETIREVDEFSGEPAPSQDSGSSAGHDTSGALTPRAKSSLAKKLAKSLGFHSHKDSTRDATANKRAASEQHERQEPDDKQSPDRGVHFNSQTTSDRPASVTKSVVTLVASSGTSSGSTAADKQAFPGTGGNANPNSSFNSVASGRVPKALSASLDDDSSQMRKSRMAPGNPLSYSGDLEQLKPKPSMPDQPAGDERTASGMLSAKSRRSSAYSLKSMDDASDTEKDLSPLARANSENPWGPKRSVGSFTSGVSGRARGDASPRLRGAYAEIQIKDMDQQLSDARMRIVQLTAEVQSSKQKVQHHEENEAALQSQLDELKQVKDSPVKTVMEKLSSARSEASSLSEQLAAAKHDAEVQHKENLKLQKSLSEHSAAHQQAVDAVKKDLDSQKAASKAAKDQLQEQVAALTEQCNSYEVVLKNKDTKGQLMSLQQTLRQEIHAKIGAQSAEESAKRKVSELQGSMQELQEALDQETTAHRQAQSTLEEAYRHRNNLEARNDELEAELAASGGSAKPAETSTDTSAARGAADVGEHSLWQQLAQRLKEVEAREQAVHDLEETLKAGKQTELKDKEAKDKEAKEQQAMYFKVDELEKALTEANNRLTRIDEADKRFVSSPGSSPAAASSEVAAKAEAKPTPNSAAPAKQITSWRRISVDDDRVDAVISHLEGMNTTLKSLRSEGGDLEPYLGSDEDLASELEKERTGRIIAQQTANQEKLQARASAAESASLRRQLNELAQQMEQEKKAAAAKQQGQQAAETGMQQSHSFAEREIDRQGGFSPAFSGGLEGHAADKPSQQAFTRQSSGSPAWSVQDQQPTKVDEGIQATELEMQQGGQGVQQRSGSATPLSEEETGDSSKQEGQGLPSGQGMEKNYTDTIESLLSELWKERLARQRAELNATDAEDKLKAYVWAADPRNGEGVPGEGEQAKAMADLDASLMQRLDEDSATNHRLLDSLKAAQGNSQALQQRVEGLEVALRRQDSLVEKLQAGAKRHLEVSLRQGTTRKNLQQATQKEDKLRHQLTRTEAELAATRRLQRDQAAHFHASNKQVGDELVESQAQLSQQAGRLSKEGERRRHLEALLDEGLQVQNQILLGLQELVAYLKQEGHLEGHPGSGIMQAPNLDQLINLLQRSQANSSSALSRSSTRQGLGRQQSSPSRVRSAPSQRGNFGVSGTLEEGTPPVELSTSPPGTSTFSRPAWLVPGFRTEQRAAARKDGSKRSSSSFGATASRCMNPRASLKPDAEPDRVFRARSVPRGMSTQRSRVADYIKVGSPIQRGSSTQVLPATSSDLVSMDRELISAQHDRAFMFAPHQGAGNAEGLNRSKPGSLLSMDTGNAARDAGSFSSYDKLQGMASLPDNMHVQHANANGMAAWGQQTMDGFASALSVSTTSYGTRGRHTHDE
ncbi:hypothetical protein WJX77_009499 [Trebouxia sp. C0004]